jgi:predicted MFS family arabinose efflux permease
MADTVGWRWAFAFQIPFLSLAFVGVWFFLNYKVRSEVKATEGSGKLRTIAKRIDWWGSGGLIVSVSSELIELEYEDLMMGDRLEHYCLD